MRIKILIFMLAAALSTAVIAEDVQVGSRLFKDVEVSKVEPDGVTMRHSTGAIKASFQDLPQSWKDRFSYSPELSGIYQEMVNVYLASKRQLPLTATAEQRVYRDVIKKRIMARLTVLKPGKRATVEAARLNAKVFGSDQSETSVIVFDEENTAKVHEGPKQRQIRLVEEPMGTLKVMGLPKGLEAGSSWSGWIYPTAEATGGAVVYSADLKIAVRGELVEPADAKPLSRPLWIGARDGITFPLRVFEVKGMEFAPAKSRTFAYWCGAVGGGLLYPIVLALLLSLRKKKPGF